MVQLHIQGQWFGFTFVPQHLPKNVIIQYPFNFEAAVAQNETSDISTIILGSSASTRCRAPLTSPSSTLQPIHPARG